MNDRERWIIYPLLFLALGVALRDKIIKTTASQRVQSESLLVANSAGQPIAVFGHERFDNTMTRNIDQVTVDVVRTNRIELVDAQGRFVSAIAPAIATDRQGQQSLVTQITGQVVVEQLDATRLITGPQGNIDKVYSKLSFAGTMLAPNYQRLTDRQVMPLLYLVDPGAGVERNATTGEAELSGAAIPGEASDKAGAANQPPAAESPATQPAIPPAGEPATNGESDSGSKP
jgi:hypothetical protein